MDFSPSPVVTSIFPRLRRGASVIGDQEVETNPLYQFQSVARNNPEADRLIMSSDGLDVTAAPKPFFGVSLSIFLGASEKEIHQNRTILAKFQEALFKSYGTRVTDFAFPDLQQLLLRGAQLDSKTIKRVLQDASLFERVFQQEDLSRKMETAVKADIDAMAACKEFQNTSTEHDALYQEAQNAHLAKEAAANSVTSYIRNWLQLSRLTPDDPKRRELEELQTLWRAASQESPEERDVSDVDLEIFKKAALMDSTQGDRLILNRDRTHLESKPRFAQGWTGAAIQWVAGRDASSLVENRRTISEFRRALVKKYGYAVTNFVFPTSLERLDRGSRLNSQTIKKTLEKAKAVSDLLGDSQFQSLAAKWTNAVKNAESAERSYRAIKRERDTTAIEKDEKLKNSDLAYNDADRALLDYFTRHALDENITISQSARLHHLWFDEARTRYRKSQAEMSPSTSWESELNEENIADRQEATNPNYRSQTPSSSFFQENDTDSSLDSVSEAVATIPSAPALPVAIAVDSK